MQRTKICVTLGKQMQGPMRHMWLLCPQVLRWVVFTVASVRWAGYAVRV